MKPTIQIETKIRYGESRIRGETVYETRIMSGSHELGRMRHHVPREMVQLGGPPVHYMFEREVRAAVQDMLAFT